jgi:BASS family bile acid:Na+ symporter
MTATFYAMELMRNGRLSSVFAKLRGEDVALFIAIAASMSAGVMLPSFGIIFEPYLLVWLGLLLFLNLIRLNLHDLASTFKKPTMLIALSIVKLVALPVALYFLTKAIYEPLAVPVLLLSGISTGLGAPFVINAVEKSKKLPLVVGMVIVTSLGVPFALPSIVYFLLGTSSEFEIPILDMVFLLAVALFIPIIAGWFAKRQWPAVAQKVDKKSFPVSIILISLMNLGVFANFSDFFFKEPGFVLVNVSAAFALFAVFGATGYFAGSIRNRVGRISKNANVEKTKDLGIVGLVTMTYVNNILVVVFASQFFSIDVAALAAFYNLPYYGLILLLKILTK